jgi:hypothetical protein
VATCLSADVDPRLRRALRAAARARRSAPRLCACLRVTDAGSGNGAAMRERLALSLRQGSPAGVAIAAPATFPGVAVIAGDIRRHPVTPDLPGRIKHLPVGFPLCETIPPSDPRAEPVGSVGMDTCPTDAFSGGPACSLHPSGKGV